MKNRLLPKTALSQHVCTYKDIEYNSVTVPGCPPHVSPHYSYPVARSCSCDKCNTDYTDCTHETVRTNHCIKPTVASPLKLF
ncbi:thyrotropin subunit beta [Latimeria chalumnae]|uniref:thyrotropin subunit beta n=1 Tax=Latimeria chalumnae TaxID=7897 RepID=UPI00313E2969